jgi:hypothetical protein
MQRHITEKQFKSNVAKFGFKTFDTEVLDSINGVHEKVVGDLMKQFKKQKQNRKQKGGRVAFPIAYFGGDAPSSAPEISVASVDGDIRPEMPLNDPSGVLGTDKAMQPYIAEGGRRPHFAVTKKAVQSTMKHLQEETGNTFDTSAEAQNFVNVTKQKIEDVMTDILSKASNTAKSTVSKASNTANNTVNLGAAKIADILRLKKYQTFKV